MTDKPSKNVGKPAQFWKFEKSAGFNPQAAKSAALRAGGNRADKVLKRFD